MFYQFENQDVLRDSVKGCFDLISTGLLFISFNLGTHSWKCGNMNLQRLPYKTESLEPLLKFKSIQHIIAVFLHSSSNTRKDLFVIILIKSVLCVWSHLLVPLNTVVQGIVPPLLWLTRLCFEIPKSCYDCIGQDFISSRSLQFVKEHSEHYY